MHNPESLFQKINNLSNEKYIKRLKDLNKGKIKINGSKEDNKVNGTARKYYEGKPGKFILTTNLSIPSFLKYPIAIILGLFLWHGAFG
jgi:hypothetical protein